MRLRGWPHVVVIAALASARAHAAVPDWTPGPATFAVTPFENHVPNGASMQWVVAEAPFEIAEKTAGVLGLDAVDPPLYVGGDAVPAEADTVAAFAAHAHASFVVTGWFDKVGEDLRIDVVIWKATPGHAATVAGEAQQRGAQPAYHAILGAALADAWTKAGVTVEPAQRDRLNRALATDLYPVFMTGRGLGYLTGATGAVDLKAAEHDLERAVFLDPKLFEAQRLLGELYLRQGTDPKSAAKATAKFNYAVDLAPDDVPALRASALETAAAGKWDPALALFTRLVGLRPWDVGARFELGRAMWELGDAAGAERQLAMVTQHATDPDVDLRARRVLVLIHASRGDTKRLATELEAIATRAPADLEVKSDLATAYAALGRWREAIAELEAIAKAKPDDIALAMRVGDAHRRAGDAPGALAWYTHAQRLAPESSLPGFVIAEAQFDAGQLPEANRTFTNLQKFAADLPAAEHDLGVIAFVQHRADDAAWYLRKAVRAAPRVLETRRAIAAAELLRKDSAAALAQLEPALAGWPDDAVLHYLAGVAHSQAGDREAARTELQAARTLVPAQAALAALDAGTPLAVEYTPELVRPWGDGVAIAAALDRFGAASATLVQIRASYQADVVAMLGQLGKGPDAKPRASQAGCPVGVIAPAWSRAKAALARYDRVGAELEAAYRFIARHDEVGLTAGLLPNQRLAVADAKHTMRLALTDRGELRGEWARGLGPELRTGGCTDALLAAAIADPSRYHVIAEDVAEPQLAQVAPRAKPRSTFFVDNTGCADAVDVWIDGQRIGAVAPGRRSALVADGGPRTLCLLGPGAAQCGDRGTVRQVYLHDGWSVTMHCPN